MIGHTISHYKILEKLGEGGMGVVYKAHDTKLDRNVALKFLPQYMTSDPTDKERFYHEAKAAASIMHPNIAVIHEIDEQNGQLFISMEYVEGQTLKNIVGARYVEDPAFGGKSPLQLNKILDIAIQVCNGLAAAHEKGIVHRDIKSENIMITPKGQVKIMDFGLAKMPGATRLTKTGSTVGTAAYMSPEQARGEMVDQRSDIFSFGVVLYEILTDNLPFRGEHHAALMYSIVNENPQPIARFNDKVTPEIERVVSKMLAKDREVRYQHADDLLADLRHEVKKLEYAKAGYGTATGISNLSTRKFWSLKIGGSIIVVIALIFIVYIFIPFGHKTGEKADIANKKSIAVMYFENQSGEENLDKMLVEALITNLGRNKEILVVSSQRLFDILKNIGKSDMSLIDKSIATEVAKQAGVNTMLLGSIWNVGEKYNIPVQLLDVETGAVLNSDRIEENAKKEEVFNIADSLTEKIYGWLNVSLAEPLRITDAMTSSYEAYKNYEEGMRYSGRFELTNAETKFRQAIQVDSTFGMAYFQLSYVMSQLDIYETIPSVKLSEARKKLEKAKHFIKNIPEKDLQFIQYYDAMLYRDYDRADTLIRRLVQDYPQEKLFWLWGALCSWIYGRYNDAIKDISAVMDLDRSWADAYNNLAYFYCMNHDFDKAQSAANTYIALIPDSWNPYLSACDVFEMVGKPEYALKILEEGKKHVSTSDSTHNLYLGNDFINLRRSQIYTLMGEYDEAKREIQQIVDPVSSDKLLVNICLFEGRIDEGLRLLRRGIQNNQTDEIRQRFDMARLLMEQRKFKDALEEFKLIKIISAKNIHGEFNPWEFIVEYYQGLCNISKGETILAEENVSTLKRLIKERKEPYYLFLYYGLEAEIEISHGKAAEALKILQKVLPIHRILFTRIRILEARINVQLKEIEKALALYNESCTNILSRESYLGGDYLDFHIERSKVDYYKGQMYQHFNDRLNAIKFYKKAIANWINADKDYPPLVDAKAQLAMLKGNTNK